jgi:formiminoglutamase
MDDKPWSHLYTPRAGEQRIGDALAPLGEAPFVLFGIAEDLGVRANGGRPGAANSPEAVLRALLNVPCNDWVRGSDFAWGGILDLQGASSVDAIDAAVHAAVLPWIRSGAVPLVVGGGHNNALPLLWAASEAHGKPIHALNLDPHPDVRDLEGRHSGNGFSYAKERGYLERYAVLGLSEYAVNASSLERLKSTKGWACETFESWAVRGETSWESALDRMLGHVQVGPFGLEIDVDGITGAPSSAQTASGWSWLQARELAYRAGQTGHVTYVHLTELALGYATEGERPGQAKAAAMLLLDVVRGTQNLPW